MPNYCDYIMKVVGDKSQCLKFLDKLESYEEPNHFWRIFEVNVDDMTVADNNETAMYISGYCAWSIETCCRAGGYSGGVDLFSVNTKELHLVLEAYSREPGYAFEEHYLYNNGECLEDAREDIICFLWDRDEYQTYEDFKLSCPSNLEVPPEEDFVDDEVIVGGFGEEFGKWHI